MKTKVIGPLLGVLFTVCLLFWCISGIKKSQQEENNGTQSAFANALAEEIDSSVLKLSGANYSDYHKTNEIYFNLVSADAKGVDVAIVSLFKAANQLLSQDEYKDYPVVIFVLAQHYDEHAHTIIVYFSNTEDQSDVGEDHLWSMVATGLCDEWKEYDENCDYPINHKSYWEGFTGLRDVSISDELPE